MSLVGYQWRACMEQMWMHSMSHNINNSQDKKQIIVMLSLIHLSMYIIFFLCDMYFLVFRLWITPFDFACLYFDSHYGH